MLRLSRSLATRLRRVTRPSDRRSSATADAWARVERGLTLPPPPAHAARRRELAEENLRLLVTLIGQQGDAAVIRALTVARGGSDMSSSSDSAPLVVVHAVAFAAGFGATLREPGVAVSG